MSRVFLLGVPLDPVTAAEALARLRSMVQGTAQNHVMTPNNEMLVHASGDAPFRALLSRTALNIPDSTGLLWAARRTDQHLPERVTGVDTMTALCLSLTEEHPVFLLGAAEGVAAGAAEVLKRKNPHLRIAGTFAGSPRPEEAGDIIRRINESGAHVLFVAYGAPKQDYWIDEHLKAMPGVKLAMGIGGSFDFIAGTQKRAPVWMQQAGIEWLWRFVREPSRWRRMWNAVIVFPWMILTRPGAAAR